MAGYYFNTTSYNTTATSLANTIASGLSTAGWSGSAGSYSYTSGGRTSTVSFATSWSGTYFYVQLNGITYYFPVYGADLSTTAQNSNVVLSIGPHWFYLQVNGPPTGQTGVQNATLGSARAFACLTTITPVLTTDTNLDDLQWVGGATRTTNLVTSSHGTIKRGLSGTANVNGELACIRPSVQDIDAVGDKMSSYRYNSVNRYASPYWVIEDTNGIRGTLDNVVFLSENYTLSGDSGSVDVPNNNLSIYHEGENWVTTLPAGYPSSTDTDFWTPFGRPGPNQNLNNDSGGASGPIIAIKKGDGTQI